MNLKHCIRMAAACMLLSSCSHKTQNQPQYPQTTGANVGTEGNAENPNATPPSGQPTEHGAVPQQGNMPQQGNTATPEQGNTPETTPQPGTAAGGEGTETPGTHGQNPNGTEMGSGGAPTGSMAQLNDAQIAEVLNESINAVLIQSRYASTHAVDPRVRRFAQRIVAASGDEATKLTQTLQKASITPVATPTSGQLNAQGRDKFDALKAHNGTDFDHAYIDDMVTTGRDRMDMIDNKITPNVTSPELKTNVLALRTKIENHLKMAEEIQKELK